MAQFQAFSPQVAVNGPTVLSVMSGMGAFQETAARILQRHGIPKPELTGWYPQQAWLNAFKEIAETIGARTLYQIGLSIPKSAKFFRRNGNQHSCAALAEQCVLRRCVFGQHYVRSQPRSRKAGFRQCYRQATVAQVVRRLQCSRAGQRDHAIDHPFFRAQFNRG